MIAVPFDFLIAVKRLDFMIALRLDLSVQVVTATFDAASWGGGGGVGGGGSQPYAVWQIVIKHEHNDKVHSSRRFPVILESRHMLVADLLT